MAQLSDCPIRKQQSPPEGPLAERYSAMSTYEQFGNQCLKTTEPFNPDYLITTELEL